ncbi:LemA family protein [Chelatococcus sp. SYSU_G07232]|uniref:LemA family protein n=1 Tax=Chelatococcus albus TaxID=3047466 RepID=A0ABT7AK46_9HYPH|nr:LemA family protein [Chelatococcus sp. SYSU_G07232]MDJ1159751.1 LemA family protein [Chelatococcus sp. SYSU_G07232]
MALTTRRSVLAAAAAVAVAAGWLAVSVDDVPRRADQAHAAWSTVEAEFRQRAELVPSIIAVVEALNPAQADLVAELARMHAVIRDLKADPAATTDPARLAAFKKTQDALSMALGRVMDLINLYPDRRREPQIRGVLEKLETSENRIVVARSDYAAAARRYNSELTAMPDRLIAAVAHPDARPMIEGFDKVAAN